VILTVNGSVNQGVQAMNTCSQKLVTVTADFPAWWTDNTSIATATNKQINGVAPGTTNNNAQSINMYWGPTRAITIRIFRFLQQGTIQVIPQNGNPNYEYTSYVYYSVVTNPAGQTLQAGFSGISVTESVTLNNQNFPSTLVTGTGGTNANSQVVDTLSVVASQPLPSSYSASSGQYLSVGGFFVRHNTLTWSSTGPTITNLGPFS
jgi:hypothetical protein